jgi:CRISPR-associated protein Cmr3
MSPTTVICHFEPLDTWFFREARPQGSVGNSELGSQFPPPVRTLLGALRTTIGDAWFARHGGDWRGLADNPALQAIIGLGDDLGPLRASGPFLTLHGERLYPAPANLMVQTEGSSSHYFLLGLGDVVHCDLGQVRLPAFPARVPGVASLKGSKPASGWLPQTGMQRLLDGQVPRAGEIIPNEALFDEEPRLGIGRDNARRSVQEGLLYQTRHLRLRPGVSVQLHLHGLPDASLLPRRTTLRLGGEGRQAALSTSHNTQSLPAASASIAPGARFVLYHLTPSVCVPGVPAGILAGFERCRHEGADCWEGHLAGQRLRILSVACARPLREGGWDLARHEARAVQSLLAPGSVLYAQHLGEQTLPYAAFSSLADATGRGQFLAGAL